MDLRRVRSRQAKLRRQQTSSVLFPPCLLLAEKRMSAVKGIVLPQPGRHDQTTNLLGN